MVYVYTYVRRFDFYYKPSSAAERLDQWYIYTIDQCVLQLMMTYITIVGMRNFQETFETCKRSFINTFSIFIGPLITSVSIIRHDINNKKNTNIFKNNRIINEIVDHCCSEKFVSKNSFILHRQKVALKHYHKFSLT